MLNVPARYFLFNESFVHVSLYIILTMNDVNLFLSIYLRCKCIPHVNVPSDLILFFQLDDQELMSPFLCHKAVNRRRVMDSCGFSAIKFLH